MYHQLGRVTGRLVAASHLQNPLFPVAPIALQRVDVPTIVHTATQMSTVAEACPASGQRKLIPGTDIPFGPMPANVVTKQKLFQKDNDEPVFLKGGPFDNILYRLTLVLCAVGLAGVFDTIYSHAFNKK